MTALLKYKHFIAAALLVVYAFIATPVQYWHQHHYAPACIATVQPGDATDCTVSDSSNQTIEEDCKVCSHHYSIYSNDAIAAIVFFIPIIHSKEGFYAHAIPLAPYFHSANKGPPAVA